MATQGNPHGPAKRSLSGDELADLEELFDEIDEDGDQRIQFTGFSQLLEDLGADMEYEEQRAGFRKIDRDHDGAVDFTDFVDWLRGMPRTVGPGKGPARATSERAERVRRWLRES
jgi:Ca2+-binding EF-hand superfamily protein